MNWHDRFARVLSGLRLDDLRSRLLFCAAVLVFIPPLLLLPLQNDLSENNLERATYRELQYVADTQSDTIHRWFREQGAFIRLLSSLPTLRQGTSADIQVVLDETFRAQHHFDVLTYIDAGGISRASVNGPLRLYLGDRDYFRQALQGEDTFSNILSDHNTGRPAIVFTSPVYGEGGGIRGVLTGVTHLRSLQYILSSFQFGHSGKLYLAAPDGTVIAGAALDTPSSLIRGLEGFQQALKSQKGVALYEDYQGRDVIGVFQPLGLHDWLLFCEMDRHEAYAHHYQQMQMLIIGLLLITLLALALLFLGQEMFLRPLGHLTQVAEAYRRGDYTARLPEEKLRLAPSELRHLGETLNSTAEKLTTMLETMEIVNNVVTETEARYRTLVEKSMVGVYGVLNGRIMYANPRLSEMLGYDLSELSGGLPVHDIIHPDQLLEVQDKMKRRLQGEAVDDHYEARLIRRDGQVIFAEIYAATGTLGGQPALIGSVLDITARKKMEDELRRLSMHDQLTGLFNRTFFEGEMRRLSQSRRPVGVILIDANGLKLVNDTLGHSSGDALICSLADLLRQHFRGDDIVARIGGDEFAALLPGGEESHLQRIFERLHQAVGRYNHDHPELPLSIAIGYARSEPEVVSLDEAFLEADNRMYNHKSRQREDARRLILNSFMHTLARREGSQRRDAERMQDLVSRLAQRLQLPAERSALLQAAVRYHDIGLLSVNEKILEHQGRLNEEERGQIQRHAEVGQRLVENIPELAPIGEWILKHHERWDGSGYPLGLKGTDIPLEARLLALVDAYDAMRHDRPYRQALPFAAAVEELRRQAGRQFDPELTEELIAALEEASPRP